MSSLMAVPNHVRSLGNAIGIDADCEDAMQVAWRVLEPRVGMLIDRFYEHPMLADQFTGFEPEQLARLKAAQEEHWRALFLSRLSLEYENRVRRAAIAHRMIGLPVHRYLTAYFIMGAVIGDEIRDTFGAFPDLLVRVLTALPKYIALDVALTVRVYDAVTLDA